MKIKIIVISLLIIIGFGVYTVKGRENIKQLQPIELPKEKKFEIRSKIFEAQNLDYQIQDITKKRDQLSKEVNDELESLMKEYKIDKKDYYLDIPTTSFFPIKK